MTDLFAGISASLAGVGLLFTGWQLKLLRGQEGREREIALNGVVVSWWAKEAPDQSEADGLAQWVYEIAVDNPGRLPIDEIEVHWFFPCEVRRIRYTGRLSEPTRTLTLRAPVLAGGARKAWTRRLQMNFSEAHNLRSVHAQISFRDFENKPHENRWPRGDGGPER